MGFADLGEVFIEGHFGLRIEGDRRKLQSLGLVPDFDDVIAHSGQSTD
jgi:hypothetical protein